MQKPDLSRDLYTATGLWLMLSLFLIFSQSALSHNAVSKEAVTMMAFDLLALVIACFSYKWHRALKAGFGITLGILLLVSPWLFGFAGNAVATWNMGLVGLVVIVTALVALLRRQSELHYG
jgi:hypothetical protein